MQDREMHDALTSYVSDAEPAMGLTADAILAAGRRSQRTRRLAGFAGAGMAAALVAAGAVVAFSTSSPVVGGNTGSDFEAAAPCPFPPGSRPPGEIAADKPLPPGVLQWATTSVSCYLTDEIPRLLPTARFGQVPGAQGGPLLGFSHEAEAPFGNRVDSMTLIRDARGTGDLSVFVGVVDPAAAARAEADCHRETAATCSAWTGPNGETVLLSTEAEGTPADQPRNVVVRVYRGHSEINVQVSNTDRQATNGSGQIATRPEPVLTADQAVQLALSPELYLFP